MLKCWLFRLLWQYYDAPTPRINPRSVQKIMRIEVTFVPEFHARIPDRIRGLAGILSASIKRELLAEARIQMELFEETYETWNHKPNFYTDIRRRGSDWEARVWTDDEVYGYLNYGTMIRFAHMSRNFQSKTVPRWMGSRQGQGGLAYIDTKHPLPGIEAREWGHMIFEERRQHISDRTRNILDSITAAFRANRR
jgi:hypothetical protein